MEKYLTKQQVQDLITKAPSSVSTEDIINGLVGRGYKLEGLEISKSEVVTPPKPTIAEKISNFTGGKEIAQGIGQTIAEKGLVSTIFGTPSQNNLSNQIADTQKQQFDIQNNLITHIKEAKALGKDTTRLEEALKLLNEEINKTGQGAEGILNPNNLTKKEVIGDALQLGANLIPGAGKELSTLGKIGTGAATGYTYDVAQNLKENKTGTDIIKPGIGTIVGGSLPVVGALTKNLIMKPLSRIVKGLGSGVSGVGVEDLNNIINNPTKSKEISDALKKEGNIEILKKEAKTIMDGVSRIRKESNAAFGQGLDELQATDINPTIFREKIGSTLDSFGSLIKNGKRDLTNVEFSDPKNLKKANDLISKLQNVELDGKSLRKLSDDIEGKMYPNPKTEEGRAFNAFAEDLSKSLKNAIAETTPKLQEINTKWSQDRQLIDAIQSIFGDVKFKNLDEINTMAKKISGISSEGGISPEIVDNFFKRLGQNPQDFKTTESVRKIMSKNIGANKIGINISEITQALSGGIITPNLIKNIAILTGKSEPIIKNIVEKGTPTAKKLLLNSITQSQK